MARDDRIAQLLALLEEARSKKETDPDGPWDDKIVEIESDLFKEFRLEMNKGGIASLPGYDKGGMLPKDRMAKINKNIASIRLDKNKFFDLIVDAGYVKDDGSADIKKFNRAAKRVGIDVKDRSAANLGRITKFLNKKSGGTYRNVGRFSAQSIAENAASQSKGFLGQYAEKYSAATKEDFWNDAKKLQRNVNKEKISSADKVKKIARGLKLKWGVPIVATGTLLTKMGFGKALPGLDLLIPTEMGSGELPKEGTPEYEELMKGLMQGEPEITINAEDALAYQKKQNMRGGGMMNMDEMIRPLGYWHGGLHEEGNILPGNLNKEELKLLQEMKPEVGIREKILKYLYLKDKKGSDNIGRKLSEIFKDPKILKSILETIEKEKERNEKYKEPFRLRDLFPKEPQPFRPRDLFPEELEKYREPQPFRPRKLSPEEMEKYFLADGGMANINTMTAPLGYAEGGFEDRMSMLRRSMVDEENQRMREPDIISVALTLARQEGDTSEENVNLIIDQLTALMPSVTKTMEEELTPLSTQGLKYLFDKMNIMAGKKSDPMLRRDVGFERVD